MWCIWVFEEFWVTQNLGQSMLVTTPYCQWLLHLTNYGDQFQKRTLFMLKQYCLKGILAKESSPRTKDFLLRRDLLQNKLLLMWRTIWEFFPKKALQKDWKESPKERIHIICFEPICKSLTSQSIVNSVWNQCK